MLAVSTQLLFLAKHAEDVQSRQTILDAVWGDPFVGDPNTLDVYMGYLRKKIEIAPLASLQLRGIVVEMLRRLHHDFQALM